MDVFYDSADFDARFHCPQAELGAIWTKKKTVFRLWAPTAASVRVNLYESGTGGAVCPAARLDMVPDSRGIWTAEKTGDLNGTYYTYLVEVDGSIREVCDPYARTTGANGHRAMVLDLRSTDPAGWAQDCNPHAGKNVTDAVIYELHLRDLSMDENSGIQNKGRFLGLAETGTATPQGIPTGLDHIRNLGVTHVHLLPVYDYGFTDELLSLPQYNWGYDPVNYNVPEGSYSSDPHDGRTRVAEMKQMVKALHDNGLSVIMDVVYNHVYDGETFCFNQIVPGYFSRISPEGIWSNGSFCGNDTASERSMVRKYIVDSVNYWADEYHIDGFRFDLVGLIDTATIREIVETVHRKHPDVIFYGEGWDMPTAMVRPGCPLAIQAQSGNLPGFAFFSDTIRDLLRGDVRDDSPGFVSGAPVSKEDLVRCFMGMPEWAAQPCQVVNYVSCHDNHTLFDRISLSVPHASREERIRMNNLAAAFSILSQGIPFLQAGEEMLRTKPDGKGGFDENSYRSPDCVNAIKWTELSTEESAKNVRYYRGLIAFRKAHPCLRLKTREEILQAVVPVSIDDPQGQAFLIRDKGQDIFAIFNAGAAPLTVTLPEGRWEVNIFEDTAGTDALSQAEGNIFAAPISATVLTRKKP